MSPVAGILSGFDETEMNALWSSPAPRGGGGVVGILIARGES